ncbi:BQ5605_C013g07386 [Microbotryum silenes-dioicae]|uniref:BQ5605_C013g07386 protein n=1 Tax=Microbotryum silenes-dioicae TaxID=796604 RepID=A0A2X0ML48_9BASI|nr:BQ5605_C013g07386 [Microbotryum silenes-dioicae]
MRFLSDALVVATFVLKSRPHPRNQGKTAIEALLGRTAPNVYVSKERRTKLASRSSQGLFIGYSHLSCRGPNVEQSLLHRIR